MKKPLRKAIFPVAGMGTRFLPATKANPKEMLPIVDKPLIQYAVEEALAVGINQLIFITSSSKRSIEDHFDKNFELETKLAQSGKHQLLELVRSIIPNGVNCTYIRQPETLGLGHALLCAKSLVHEEDVAVLLADDLIDGGESSCLKQMLELHEQTQSSVIAVEHIASQDTEKYGVVDLVPGSKTRIQGIVEKPKPEDAPSQLAVAGRYILSHRIFECLERTKPGRGGEIQLTDAIADLLIYEAVDALPFQGVRYDCGSKLGYLKATYAYGLKHPEVGEAFGEYLT